MGDHWEVSALAQLSGDGSLGKAWQYWRWREVDELFAGLVMDGTGKLRDRAGAGCLLVSTLSHRIE